MADRTSSASNMLPHSDPAYAAPRQWAMAGLIGVTFGVTLLTTYGMQATLSQVVAFVAIIIGLLGVLLLAPWRHTRQLINDRKQMHRLAVALDRAVQERRPIAQEALDLQREDDLGVISRALRDLTKQSVAARVENHSLQRRMNDRIEQSTTRATAQLQRQAMSDPLTGLGNRRLLDQELAGEFQSDQSRQQWIGVLLIDVDHFKTINDTLGHDIGDQCLKFLANLLRAGIRNTDIAARLGGDEFVVVMRGRSTKELRSAAERMAALFGQMPWGYDTVPRPTLSIGITNISPQDSVDVEEALRRADQALYAVKRAGRAGISLGGQASSAA